MDHPSPQLLAHCPVCHAAYPAGDVRLLGEKGTTRLFHCTCAACGNAVLAVVLENAGAVSSVGLVTDLEIQDALRFQDVPVISTDECLAVHRALEAESAAFCRQLLDKKRP
ncbi:MAG: hypothetical protein WA001_01900 [Patescibacteria group bacterium]